ncbi:MAG: hypothetical protein IJ048_00010 [Clostridia bacterium]|nr:hypothetical protein [Clostridia bacterium]
MASQGRYYRICRRILRLRYLQFECRSEAEHDNPAVFICRHRNAIGPIASLCLLPLGAYPWAFSAFMDTDACRRHLADYTFPVTWKINPTVSRVLAAVLGPLFAKLVCSAGGIPVYRNSLKVRETFQKTIETMDEGGSILIFPDVNYAEEDGETGALYEGFLLLEQLWNRKTGKHVQFVPVNISLSGKTMTIGKAISFTGQMPYREEKGIILGQLEDAMNSMAKKYGA